jgi:hypothetical protein
LVGPSAQANWHFAPDWLFEVNPGQQSPAENLRVFVKAKKTKEGSFEDYALIQSVTDPESGDLKALIFDGKRHTVEEFMQSNGVMLMHSGSTATLGIKLNTDPNLGTVFTKQSGGLMVITYLEKMSIGGKRYATRKYALLQDPATKKWGTNTRDQLGNLKSFKHLVINSWENLLSGGVDRFEAIMDEDTAGLDREFPGKERLPLD